MSLLILLLGSLFSWDNNPVMGLDKAFSDILIICVCIVFIKLFRLWDDAGFQRKGFLKGLKYGIPFFVIGIGSLMVGNAGTSTSSLQFISAGNTVLFTCNMLLVGLSEELWMRSLILNLFLRQYGLSKKGIWISIVLSAVIFGLVHIPNIRFVAPITLIAQVLNAASAGVLFAAIFIKSRNIWATAIIHAVVDWLSLFIENCFVGGNSLLSISMDFSQAVIIVALGSLPPLIIAWLYLRKAELHQSV